MEPGLIGQQGPCAEGHRKAQEAWQGTGRRPAAGRSEDDWRPNLVEHGYVEPNPGPRRPPRAHRRSIVVTSINLGGASATWRFFGWLEMAEKRDRAKVIFLQDTSHDQQMAHRIASVAKRIGYHMYTANPAQKAVRRIGGLITLVDIRPRRSRR